VYLAASGGGGSSYSSLLLIVALFAAFYFLLLRPMKRRQQKAAEEQKNMRDTLVEGTEIVTIGGLYGTVVGMDDDSVTLEISEGVTARYDRNAIARIVTPVDAEETFDDEADDNDADDPDADDVTDTASDTASDTDRTDLDKTASSVVDRKD
jgi:preprotein translocase subunit YajC